MVINNSYYSYCTFLSWYGIFEIFAINFRRYLIIFEERIVLFFSRWIIEKQDILLLQIENIDHNHLANIKSEELNYAILKLIKDLNDFFFLNYIL